jgi:hypothetical protein
VFVGMTESHALVTKQWLVQFSPGGEVTPDTEFELDYFFTKL